MRRIVPTTFVVAALLATSFHVDAAGNESCADLASERTYLVREAKRLTEEVELKNVELGDAAASLAAAKSAPRRVELQRQSEALRRDLTLLLDRELEATNRLGFLDSTIAKRCTNGGGK